MSDKPAVDLQACHKRLAVDCFNRTWDLIDQERRSPEEDERMLQLAMASAWHWAQRDDCTAKNLSVGYWQISRVHALLGRADEARRYGMLSLEQAKRETDDPFTLGYAYEALARAESVAGDHDAMSSYLDQARKAGDSIADGDARAMLLDDLSTVEEN